MRGSFVIGAGVGSQSKREVLTTLSALPRAVSELKGERHGAIAVLADFAPITVNHANLATRVTDLLAPCGPVRLTRLGPPDGQVRADEVTVAAAVRAAIGAAVIVTVGSGRLAELGSVAAARAGEVPHVVVRTEAGGCMFTGDRSVLLIDPEILAGAKQADVGELASRCTATADWYLACAIGIDDSYSPALDGGSAVGAMPAGTEHAVSHLIDMSVGGNLHGAQVGVATLAAARAWQHVREALDTGRYSPRVPFPVEQRARITAAFTQLGESASAEHWRAYRHKLDWLGTRPAAAVRLLHRWTEHTAMFNSLLADANRLSDTLAAAGLPIRFRDLSPSIDRETARWAVANCHLTRARFGIADFADLLGRWEPEDVDAVLADLW